MTTRARKAGIIVVPGAQGPQGPQGVPGEGGLFSFEIEEGDLILYYGDNEEPPDFEIDENGDLIYNFIEV